MQSWNIWAKEIELLVSNPLTSIAERLIQPENIDEKLYTFPVLTPFRLIDFRFLQYLNVPPISVTEEVFNVERSISVNDWQL